MYDNTAQHRPRSLAVIAAWTAALDRLLGPPTSVLDCGAGTGFLSLVAARLGHRVTALDVSEEMLIRLRRKAEAEGLRIRTVVGPAHEPPEGNEIVIERHLMWTLPEPAATLRAWRQVSPNGRLVLFESLWGVADPLGRYRAAAQARLRRMRGEPPHHHAEYGESLRSRLPMGQGTAPSALIDATLSAGWRAPQLERLRDVEWAERSELPIPERLVGTASRVVVTALA